MADSKPAPLPPSEEERDKFAAEADKARAEARLAHAEAEEAEHKAAVAALERDKAEETRARARFADPYRDHVYRFLDQVADPSVNKCLASLDAWHREDPKCKMTIVFDSPGGGVIEGFHLFDHILELRRGGHEIITMTRGYAASMAGILLQAGEERVMGPNAHLMLHEVSFGAHGKIGQVEDAVEFAKMLQSRALDIFADRCKGADDDTATKKLSRRQIANKWARKDFWINAQDALAYGLVDAVR